MKSTQTVTEVVAALIRDEQGRLLICQRPAHKARGFLWEFFGGKVDAGETPEQALVRECREELDVGLKVGGLYDEVTHQYPDLLVRVRFYAARIAEGSPKRLEHADLRWVRDEELGRYDFCPADTDLLAKLAAKRF